MQIKNQKIIKVFFVLYILALVWIILFKLQLSVDLLPQIRELNLIPFYDDNIHSLRIYIGEKIYNLLLFIPFGLYVCLLKKDWSFAQKIKPIFLTSLSLELIQLVFGIGTSDVTDLIQNTLGGMVGIGVFYLFKKIFKNNGYKLTGLLVYFLTTLMLIFIALLKTFIRIKVN